jgi:hypothetical protein
VIRLDLTTIFNGIVAVAAVLTFWSQRRLTIFALRAQLVIDPKGPYVADFAVGRYPRLDVEMKNVGKMPAYWVTTTCQMAMVYSPFKDFPAETISTTEYQTRTIYPGVYSVTLNLH